jgi:hypothetical protein
MSQKDFMTNLLIVLESWASDVVYVSGPYYQSTTEIVARCNSQGSEFQNEKAIVKALRHLRKRKLVRFLPGVNEQNDFWALVKAVDIEKVASEFADDFKL